MPEMQRQSRAGAPILTSAILGAVTGAGSLAWWLWRQSKRRQMVEREQRLWRLSLFQGGVTAAGHLPEPGNREEALPERVQQLNQAIEEVRRQLEALQGQS